LLLVGRPRSCGLARLCSANDGAAVSFVAKQPALMLDDIFSTFGASDPNFSQDLAKANSELGLDLRNDLASALGGELTLALDGPVLPTPSWESDYRGQQFRCPSACHGKDGAGCESGSAKVEHARPNAQSNTVRWTNLLYDPVTSAGLSTEYNYTFADGYMIMAPSRALLLAALQTHANGTSLARSASFHALLPSDSQANFSAMIYQNP